MVVIELSNLLKRNVSTYTGGAFDFDDCIYEIGKEGFYENVKENKVGCYIMKDDKRIYLTDDMIKRVEYDYDIDFENVKIGIAEMIGNEIDKEINLEEIFSKYGIMYVGNSFYTPKYYNFDNDSYDIELELKEDEDTYGVDFLEKYGLVELVQDYIDNIRIPSYDGYMSYEPKILEDVERNDYCTIYAILKKEGIFETLQKIFDDIIMNCYAEDIRLENLENQRYTLDEYTYEDGSTGYERNTKVEKRKTYDVLFE